MKERLIDLAPVLMDDENSNYADQIQEKQAKFNQEFDSKLREKGHQEVFGGSALRLDTAQTAPESEGNMQELLN